MLAALCPEGVRDDGWPAISAGLIRELSCGTELPLAIASFWGLAVRGGPLEAGGKRLVESAGP